MLIPAIYGADSIIIDDQDKTRSGVLVFRRIDLPGNEGTEITEGSEFLLDTVKPAPPAGAAIRAAEDGIRPHGTMMGKNRTNLMCIGHKLQELGLYTFMIL